MSGLPRADYLVVGSGPNGLAAAIELARSGFSVAVVERSDEAGGGLRSAALTLPGFVHDVCSAIHPLAAGSPFLSALPLAEHGLRWVHPDAPLAHPLDDGTAVLLERSVAATAESVGEGSAWGRLVSPLAEAWEEMAPDLLGPLRLPCRPLLFASFGLRGLLSARGLADYSFQGIRGRALLAGLAAHSFLPLELPVSGAVGMVLAAAAHAAGWPFPQGGAGRLAAAMESCLVSLGGRVETGMPVESLRDLPECRGVLLDVTPRQLLSLAGGELPPFRRRRLARYRYGPGVCKLDWALSGPVPWKAGECRRAGTVHLGGTLEEIAASEHEVCSGIHPERPFVLLAQHTLFDPGRAPEGMHTAWGYCHVPADSAVDMTERIERQVERFAPGFRELIVARRVMTAAGYEAYNPNCVGGDINGGVQDLGQLFSRPVSPFHPYDSGIDGLWLCSSSTPPGGGIHGMSGYHAARRALRQGERGVRFTASPR